MKKMETDEVLDLIKKGVGHRRRDGRLLPVAKSHWQNNFSKAREQRGEESLLNKEVKPIRK